MGEDKGSVFRWRFLVKEFWHFLWSRKLWWLAPILAMLALVAVLILFSEASAVSVFVYALF